MDIQIEKKTGLRAAFTKKSLPWWGASILVLFIIIVFAMPHESKLKVDSTSFTTGDVKFGQFNDYMRVSGQVQPIRTIQLSPQEGGIVQEIVIDEGSQVKKGDVILVLSNDNLDLQILNSEAELAEKENILRNTLISMEQQKLSLEQEKLQLNVEVRRAKRDYNSKKALYDERLISKEDYLVSEENYQLALDKLNLVKNRIHQDSLYRSVEVQQMNESLANMRTNMLMIRKRKENLTIKSPIDGELGMLEVVLGQSIASGMKIGQISDLTDYKIESQIDEHYIDRVTKGLEATFMRQTDKFYAEVRKVYPEVRDGKFKADFCFGDERPDNIRTGQTYYIDLQLGLPTDAVLVPRGTFYQKTAGKWIYVLSDDGQKAFKREIKIGRQNPQYYEVIEGLKAGEKVIVTGYENFGEDNDVLVIED